MYVEAKVYRTRRAGERFDTEARSTLRSGASAPIDVVVDQVSRSGCHIVTAETVDVGEIITLGIAGLGRVEALVVRRTPSGYGCAFISHVPESLLREVGVESPVLAIGAEAGRSVYDPEIEPPDIEKYPVRTRFLVIVGFCVLSWICIISFIAMI